jgi:diguanylate cyclase (GGDEF)-like protein
MIVATGRIWDREWTCGYDCRTVKTRPDRAEKPTVSVDNLDGRAPETGNIPQVGIFVVLGSAHVVGLTTAPLLTSGAWTAAIMAVEVIAVAIAVAALILRLRGRQVVGDPVVLAVVLSAAVASALRMAVVGNPWAGMDVVLAIVAVAAVRDRRYYLVGLVGTLLSWALGAVAAMIHAGPNWVAWGGAVVAVGAVAGLVSVLRAGVQALEHTLGELRENAEQEAVRDVLTGAVNRRGLEMLGLPLVENARRQGEAVHCLFVDVDDFKGINASAGFDFADQVLITMTEAIKGSVRATDSVGRWSGDQFVVIGPGTGTSPLELERRVRHQLSQLDPGPDTTWQGRVSIGSATLVPWDEGDLDALIGRAEQDMRLRRSLRRQGAVRTSTARARRPRLGGAVPGEHQAAPRPGSAGTGEEPPVSES